MSDEPKTNKGELIPSINRGLAIKKSGLVQRGLELTHELKKQQVRILIGNFDDVINNIFIDIIKEVIKGKYDLKLGSSSYCQELLELAESGAVDIFILVMNNIRFSSVDSVVDRLVNSLQLITQIKATCGRPVIALSGWREDPLIEGAKLAADFFFHMPFKFDAFKEAFEKCLEMLHGFNEVPGNRFKNVIPPLANNDIKTTYFKKAIVIFQTEDALFHFDRKKVTKHLKFTAKEHNLDNGTKLLEFISNHTDKTILIPEEEYYFGYVALYLISQGKGSVTCKTCNQTYQSKVLKQFSIGRGKSPYDVDNVVFEKPIDLKGLFGGPHLPIFGGKGYKCPKGHELIARITWRT